MSTLSRQTYRWCVVPLLALGALALGMPSAAAADATLTLDAATYSSDETVRIAGTCDNPAATTVILTLTQGAPPVHVVLDQRALDVAANGSFSVDLSPRTGATGPAVAASICLAYGSSASLGSAETELGIDAGAGVPSSVTTTDDVAGSRDRDDSGLANTGASTSELTITAVLLMLAGAAAIVISRRAARV